MCQCPLSGFLHFYALAQEGYFNELMRVNALYRAFSISTWRAMGWILLFTSVNALYRAFSISTNSSYLYNMSISFPCQCPLSGFLHFYGLETLVDDEDEYVSMPFIGLSPFLRSPLGTP